MEEDSFWNVLSSFVLSSSLLNILEIPNSPENVQLQDLSGREERSEEREEEMEILSQRGDGESQAQNTNQRLVLRTQQQPKRSSNNIFKTPLSQFKKAIFRILEVNYPNAFLLVRRKLNDIYDIKNQGVFPRLLSVIRQVDQQWSQRIRKLVEKKQDLVKMNKYTQERLQELNQIIHRMNLAIAEQDILISFDKYWGNYRQNQKYTSSKRKFIQFIEQFSNLGLPETLQDKVNRSYMKTLSQSIPLTRKKKSRSRRRRDKHKNRDRNISQA